MNLDVIEVEGWNTRELTVGQEKGTDWVQNDIAICGSWLYIFGQIRNKNHGTKQIDGINKPNVLQRYCKPWDHQNQITQGRRENTTRVKEDDQHRSFSS